MLYEQIRYAEVIRKMYRMRHLLSQKKPPDMGTRLGYPKYSKQFYRIKSKFREEGIIGSGGTFVESLPNMHVVVMPLRVDMRQIGVLGNRVPYVLFLALVVDSPRRGADLARECRVSAKAARDALRRMAGAGIVRTGGGVAAAVEDSPAYAWLAGYLAAARSWMDVSGDTSVLFNTVPSYVGGPYARHLLDYEPGAPMGSAEMKIFTYKPFLGLMESIVRESLYFGSRSRRVSVGLAGDDPTRRVGGIPYLKDAGGADGR